jgi:hypothetical protein
MGRVPVKILVTPFPTVTAFAIVAALGKPIPVC